MSSEILPQCWDDDTRMDFLFAPFRTKSLNPVGWESKMDFWTDLIEKWCSCEGRSSFTLNDLKNAFRRKTKTPACLANVLEQMMTSNSIDSKENVERQMNASWLRYSIYRIGKWTVSSIVSPFVNVKNKIEDTTFVHMKTLQKQSLLFLSSIPENCRIGTMIDLKNSSSIGEKLDNDNLMLILNWLVAHNFATTNGELFKLAKNENSKITPISQSEICLRQLSQTKKHLEKKMDELNENMSKSRDSAKQSVIDKNKSIAMHHLKQKKRYETRLIKISNTIHSLTEIYDSLEQINTDVEVVAAFKNGLNTLKSTMKDSSLEEDKVEDTMDSLKEAMEEYRNIEEMLSRPIDQECDMDELEEELNKLTLDEDSGNYGGDINSELNFDAIDENKKATPGRGDSTKTQDKIKIALDV